MCHLRYHLCHLSLVRLLVHQLIPSRRTPVRLSLCSTVRHIHMHTLQVQVTNGPRASPSVWGDRNQEINCDSSLWKGALRQVFGSLSGPSKRHPVLRSCVAVNLPPCLGPLSSHLRLSLLTEVVACKYLLSKRPRLRSDQCYSYVVQLGLNTRILVL